MDVFGVRITPAHAEMNSFSDMAVNVLTTFITENPASLKTEDLRKILAPEAKDVAPKVGEKITLAEFRDPDGVSRIEFSKNSLREPAVRLVVSSAKSEQLPVFLKEGYVTYEA